METEIAVAGMTCEHCENRVSAEIGRLPGVTQVTASASSGRVTLTSTAPVPIEDLRAAVDEAGYDLANV